MGVCASYENSRLPRIVSDVLEYLLKVGMKEGSKVPSETELAERLGVSRPLIREAVRSLASLGLLETRNGVGSTFRGFNSDALNITLGVAVATDSTTLDEILSIREWIEVNAASVAAVKRTDDHLSEMYECLFRMEIAKESPLEYAGLDLKLHNLVLKASCNRVAAIMGGAVSHVSEQVMYLGGSLATPTEWQEIQKSHIEVVDAIADQNAKEAEIKMVEHFQIARERFLRCKGSMLRDNSQNLRSIR